MDPIEPGATPETASAPAAPQSAPPATEPKSLADFATNLAAQMRAPVVEAPPQVEPATTGPNSPPAPAPDDPTPDPTTPVDPEELPPTKGEWPQSAVERIRKLKDQRKAARDEAESLKARIKELETAPTSPPPEPPPVVANDDDPLSTVSTPEQLQAKRTEAQHLVDKLSDLLDDLRDDPDSVQHKLEAAKVNLPEWTPQAMKEWLKERRYEAKQILSAAPKREEYFVRERQAAAYVEKHLPTFTDSNSPDFQLAASVLKEFPELRKRPDWLLHAAIYAKGFQAFQGQTKASSPPATPVAPRVPGTPRTAPRAVEVDALTAARDNLGKGGMDSALAYAKAALVASAHR